MRKLLTLVLGIACVNLSFGAAAQSHTNSYRRNDPASDPSPQPSVTEAHTDSNLVNPWGNVTATSGNLSHSATINVCVQ